MKIIAVIVTICCVLSGHILCNAATVTPRRRLAAISAVREEKLPINTVTTELPDVLPTVRQRMSRLSLPSNATSIRSDISDNFSCDGKPYGYYADMENDCQIFHVCLPMTLPDGKDQQFRWSFICPEETIFNQEAFTCVRNDDMPFDCNESEKFYELNRLLGLNEQVDENDLDIEESSNFKPTERAEALAIKKTVERRPQTPLRTTSRITTPLTTAATTTTTTTTTTTIAPPKTSPKTTARTSGTRRPTMKFTKRTTTTQLPTTTSTTARPTTTTQIPTTTTQIPTTTTQIPTTQSPIITTSQDYGDFTTIFYLNSEPKDATTNRIEDLETTENNHFDFLLNDNTDEKGSTVIPFDDYVTTVRDVNQRIVPELVESNTNGKIIDSSEANAAAEIVKSIKHLQNILPITPASATLPLDDPRRNRFLFKADSIANRKKLFDKLNTSSQ